MNHVIIDSASIKERRLVSCGVELSNIHQVALMSASNTNGQPPIPSRKIHEIDGFCCLFTSGSTGRPNGVQIGYEQLRYHREGYHRIIDTVEDDILLLPSATVFDASICSIYGTILYGSTIVIASRERKYAAPIP